MVFDKSAGVGIKGQKEMTLLKSLSFCQGFQSCERSRILSDKSKWTFDLLRKYRVVYGLTVLNHSGLSPCSFRAVRRAQVFL